jgi:uncharacterized membrane protein
MVLLVMLAIVLIEFRIVRYAYEKIGIDRRYVFTLLLLSLVGSYINIPIVELAPEEMATDQTAEYYGMRYVIPDVDEWPRTIIAVNVGGAVIPTLLSIYLLIKNRLYFRGLIAVAVVSFVVHLLARPIPGVGIATPVFIPPLAAAGVALLLDRKKAPALAYVAGTMGALIGADLLNLAKIQGLGAPVASIGGAGTFDGIFVTGIVAVPLA